MLLPLCAILHNRFVSAALTQPPTACEAASAMDDENLPRPKGDAASMLAKEELDPYSQHELDERIALLEAEIARVEAHREKASAHRDAAEALFGRKDAN